jgi:hypothetical protein
MSGNRKSSLREASGNALKQSYSVEVQAEFLWGYFGRPIRRFNILEQGINSANLRMLMFINMRV